MSKIKRRAEEEQAIDLTPMLDVVFIMLIFFIVTASFIKESGVEVNRAVAITGSAKQASSLIAVTSVGEVWIDKKRIDPRDVKQHVERMRAENPEGAVVIQVDEESKAEIVMKVMDSVRDAGVTDVAISTKQ